MKIGQVIFHLPAEKKQKIRKIEKINKKIASVKSSLVFNRTCIKENLLPKYTNISTHDPAAREESVTVQYRKQLINRQIELKEAELETLEESISEDYRNFHCMIADNEQRDSIINCLNEEKDNQLRLNFNRIQKKLCKLHRGKVYLASSSDSFLNLSNHSLTEKQKEFLNLGLNCHIQPKYSKLKKKIELEILYDKLLSLQRENKIIINPNLKDELRGESTRRRCFENSSILSDEMKQAAKELRSNPNIVIKKADKSNVFVIMDKEEYTNKINQILADQTKFKQITRDPTETLQRKVNKLIAAANSHSRNKTLTPIVGSYSTGYIYGNIETRKNGNPLRPIISQVSTPTYQTSKQQDAIIKPYIPKKYSLNSRDEFIDLLKSSRPDGQLASLDVSSLFTNVPVHETIDIILGNVYHHPSLPPPSIEKETQRVTLSLYYRIALQMSEQQDVLPDQWHSYG